MSLVKRLQAALFDRERAQALLANLERMKDEGALEQAEYSQLKAEYSGALVQANALVDAIRREVDAEVASRRRQVDLYGQQQRNLETRLKVGELDAASYEKVARKTQANLRRLQDEVGSLERLGAASTSAELGVRGGRPSSAGRGSTARLGTPFAASLSGRSGPVFGFIDSWDDVVNPRSRLVAPVASLVLFVSVFLRWLCIGNDLFTMSVSATGNGGLVAMAVIGFVLCSSSISLAHPTTRGVIQTALGGIAFIVGVCVVFGGGGDSFGFESYSIASGLREGFYLYVASAAAMVVGGILTLKEA
ncbi:MAG: hypothetical protein NTY63_08840 [Candidatus Bipolaricaulota bacterium]|nr:hypothetical protein [Candidatus Bipolaricaulota bacterium]